MTRCWLVCRHRISANSLLHYLLQHPVCRDQVGTENKWMPPEKAEKIHGDMLCTAAAHWRSLGPVSIAPNKHQQLSLLDLPYLVREDRYCRMKRPSRFEILLCHKASTEKRHGYLSCECLVDMAQPLFHKGTCCFHNKHFPGVHQF